MTKVTSYFCQNIWITSLNVFHVCSKCNSFPQCLGGYFRSAHEPLENVFLLRIRGHAAHVIACPASPFWWVSKPFFWWLSNSALYLVIRKRYKKTVNLRNVFLLSIRRHDVHVIACPASPFWWLFVYVNTIKYLPETCYAESPFWLSSKSSFFLVIIKVCTFSY